MPGRRFLLLVPLAAACGAVDTESTTAATSTTSTSETFDSAPPGRGPGGVDVESVSAEDELIAMVQEAYGDANLDLHGGHQPVPALDNVLG